MKLGEGKLLELSAGQQRRDARIGVNALAAVAVAVAGGGGGGPTWGAARRCRCRRNFIHCNGAPRGAAEHVPRLDAKTHAAAQRTHIFRDGNERGASDDSLRIEPLCNIVVVIVVVLDNVVALLHVAACAAIFAVDRHSLSVVASRPRLLCCCDRDRRPPYDALLEAVPMHRERAPTRTLHRRRIPFHNDAILTAVRGPCDGECTRCVRLTVYIGIVRFDRSLNAVAIELARDVELVGVLQRRAVAQQREQREVVDGMRPEARSVLRQKHGMLEPINDVARRRVALFLEPPLFELGRRDKAVVVHVEAHHSCRGALSVLLLRRVRGEAPGERMKLTSVELPIAIRIAAKPLHRNGAGNGGSARRRRSAAHEAAVRAVPECVPRLDANEHVVDNALRRT